MKSPLAIIVGDLHLRETVPECRTDDWFKTMADKLGFIRTLQGKYSPGMTIDVQSTSNGSEEAVMFTEELDMHQEEFIISIAGAPPILCAGDIFDKAKPTLYMVRWAMQELKHGFDNFTTVPSNHDMPYHNEDLLNKSGVGVLETADFLHVLRTKGSHNFGTFALYAFPWGAEPSPLPKKKRPAVPTVALMHAMVYDEKPWAGVEGWEARDLIEAMPGFDLIITGHNHQTFVVKHKGTTLVNPGSVLRLAADQVEHKPCVFLWDGKGVEPVYIPISRRAISRDYLETQKRRDARIEAFVEHLSTDYEVGLSFERNLEKFLKKNKVRDEARSLLEEALQG